jgi:micrococcal nuclease
LKLRFQTKWRFSKLSIALAVVLGIAIGLVIGYGIWHGNTATPNSYEKALVVSVIDGDTIQLQDGIRVRYLGIDTPETGEPYYLEATARNRELVEGKVVYLQKGRRDRDEYNRLLRYVYIDGVFVNAELVAQGFAKAYIFDTDEWYSQTIVRLEQYAKQKKRGLWGQ